LLLEQDAERFKETLWPAALVCSVIANVNRDSDKRSEPWTPADFMPGARSEEDEMREFAERVLRGDKFDADPDAVRAFRHKMEAAFNNVKPASERFM